MASLVKRGNIYYIQYYLGGTQRRECLNTNSLQIAKEKKRQYESAELTGADNPLPAQTPIADVVSDYVQRVRLMKTAKSAQTDIYYLREMFGEVCAEVACTSRTRSEEKQRIAPVYLRISAISPSIRP